MIDKYYTLRRESHEDEPIYITLCFVLQGSGAEREEVTDIFNVYMKEGEDYDKPEYDEMVDYLFKVAQDD